MFKALLVDRDDTSWNARVDNVDESSLPEGDVSIDVDYSSINYKDGLAVTGKGKIIRGALPFVPGIDLVGRVSEATSNLNAGDPVIVTGWGIGEKTWGGFAQKARVKSEWIVPLPAGLDPRNAMVLGTAGLTAMLAVMALEAHGCKPGSGEVVVTGATGGVGSIAVAILARRGFEVVASTGSADKRDFLTTLGATRIIDRDELPAASTKAMDSAIWNGAIDTAGGTTLAGILAQLQPHASVAACGNAAGFELDTTVFPFILRGVNLLGIDSNTATLESRVEAWGRLAHELPAEILRTIEAGVVTLNEIAAACERITRGDVDGRLVVDVNR